MRSRYLPIPALFFASVCCRPEPNQLAPKQVAPDVTAQSLDTAADTGRNVRTDASLSQTEFANGVCMGKLGVHVAPPGEFTSLVHSVVGRPVLTSQGKTGPDAKTWTGNGAIVICDGPSAKAASIGPAVVVGVAALSPTALLVRTYGREEGVDDEAPHLFGRIRILMRSGKTWQLSPFGQLEAQYPWYDGHFLGRARDNAIAVSDRRANMLRVVTHGGKAGVWPQVTAHPLGEEGIQLAAQNTFGGTSQLEPFLVGAAPDGEVRLYHVQLDAAPHVEQFASFLLPGLGTIEKPFALGQIVLPSRKRAVGRGRTMCQGTGSQYEFDVAIGARAPAVATTTFPHETPLGRLVLASTGEPIQDGRCKPFFSDLSVDFGARGQRLYGPGRRFTTPAGPILACVEALAVAPAAPARWCRDVSGWLPEGFMIPDEGYWVQSYWRKGGVTVIVADRTTDSFLSNLVALIVADEFGNTAEGESGPCKGMILEDCADTNPCSADLCDASHDGCYHEPLPDGLACGVNKVCKGGMCK